MTTTTYAITRPLMNAAELAARQVTQYGRNYAESCDGYEDMEAECGRSWRPLSSWGRDGWDLGSWPYVVIYVRDAGDNGSLFVPGFRHELMQVCEGDRTQYAFASREDRDAAIDYLFLWYAADEDWAPLSYADRSRLDAGDLAVEDKFRGPYRAS